MNPTDPSSKWSDTNTNEHLKPPLKTVRSFDTGTHGVFFIFSLTIFLY